MAIRVPTQITPRTSPGQLSVGRLNARSTDYGSLSAALGNFGDQLADEQKRKEINAQEFELNKAFLKETIDLETDYATRRDQQPLGANGFAENLGSEYETRHRDLAAEYAAKGYRPEVVQQFELKLGSLRAQKVGQAVGFQEGSFKQKITTDINDMGDAVGRYVGSQYAPDNQAALTSGLAELEHNVKLLEGQVDAPTLDRLLQANKQAVLAGAAASFTKRFPQYVIDKLDPGHQVVTHSISLGDGKEFNMSSYVAAMEPAEGTGQNPRSSANGFFQFTNGTWKQYYTQVFGNTGETDEQILAKKKDRAIASKVLEPFTAANISKLQAGGVPITNASVYLAHFLGAVDAVKVLNATEDTPVTSLVSAKSIKANPEVFGKAKTVKELVLWAAMKPGMSENAPPVDTVTVTRSPGEFGERGQTGDALLDMLDEAKRVQLLDQAQAQIKRQDAEVRGAASVAVANQVNANKMGEEAPVPYTHEDFIRIFGPVEGPQKEAESKAATAAQPVVASIKTLTAQQATARVEALKPAYNPADPGYTEKLQAYAQAKSALDENLRLRAADSATYVLGTYPNIAQMFQRAKTPEERKAGYQAMARAYEQLGVAPADRLPMPKEQAIELGKQYDGMNSQQKLQFLNQQFTEMFGTGLDRPLTAVMAQNAGTLGRDSFMFINLRGHPEFRSVMSDVLAGERAIADDPARKPPEYALTNQFKTIVGTKAISTLNPTLSKFYNEAAAAIYIANGGNFVQGMPDNVAGYQEALRRAVGGVKGNPDTGILQNYSKIATILPPTVTGTQWNQWLTRITLQDIINNSTTGRFPVDAFGNKPARASDITENATFVQRAAGVYAIYGSDGNPYVDRVTGNPYLVKVTPQWVNGK